MPLAPYLKELIVCSAQEGSANENSGYSGPGWHLDSRMLLIMTNRGTHPGEGQHACPPHPHLE